MRNFLAVFFFLFSALTLEAQIGLRPDFFTEQTNPTNSNFEVYSQKGGITRRASLNNLKKWVAPFFNPDTIAYTPSTSGNTTDLASFVYDPTGLLWYIDGQGNAVYFTTALGTDGNGLISALPAGNVTINADGNNLVIDSVGLITLRSTYADTSYSSLGIAPLAGTVTYYDDTDTSYAFLQSNRDIAFIGFSEGTAIAGAGVWAKNDTVGIGRVTNQISAIEVNNVGPTANIRTYGDTLDISGMTTLVGFPGGGLIDSLSYYGDTLRLYQDANGTYPIEIEIVAGVDTDNQTIDTFDIATNTLRLSLQDDGQAFKSVSLSPYLDNTDDQTIDTFSLTGSTLNLSLEADGQAKKTVDLSSLSDGNGIYDNDGTIAPIKDMLVKLRRDTTFSIADCLNCTGYENANAAGAGKEFNGLFLSDPGNWGMGIVSYLKDSSAYGGLEVYAGSAFLSARYGSGANKFRAGVGVYDTRASSANEGKVQIFGTKAGINYSYLLADVTPSASVGDTSVMVWAGGDTPLFLDKSDFGQVNTDNQTIDTATIVSDTIRLSLSGDGQPAKVLNLKPYLDNTDDQVIDTFSLSGTTISLSLEADGQAAKTVNLSGLSDGNGFFDATNEGDTIRVSNALLRASVTFQGGPYTTQFTSTSGNAIYGASTTGYGGYFTVNPTSTSSFAPSIYLMRTSSGGNGGVGLGNGIYFGLETSVGGTTNAGYIGVKWTDPVLATRTAAFDVNLPYSGSDYTRLSLAGSGQLTLNGYAYTGLTSTDSSLYVITSDATGDVWKRSISGLNGIYGGNGTLPTGGSIVDLNGETLQFDDNSAGGSVEWYIYDASDDASLVFDSDQYTMAIKDKVTDNQGAAEMGTNYSGLYVDSTGTAKDHHIRATLSGVSVGDGTSGVPTASLDVNGDLRVQTTVRNDTLTKIAALNYTTGLVGWRNVSTITGAAQTLALSNDSLSISGGNTVDLSSYLDDTDNQTIDTFAIVANVLRLSLQDDAQAFKSVSLSSYLDNTDGQTLSASNDTVTISTGNSLKLPLNEMVTDSLTNDSITFNLETRYNKIYKVDMTSAGDPCTVLLTNPIAGGVYTFHFTDITGTQAIVWPSTVKDLNNTALGTVTYNGPIIKTLYYDGSTYVAPPDYEPNIGFDYDSIAGTTLTIDLSYEYQHIHELKMTSATNLTLTISNPVSGGVYTFHFLDISSTDNVTWPANFYDANGTALGTDALTAGTFYTCYYNGNRAKYYCK